MQQIQNETKRIETLKRYQILDTPQDGSFNRLTKLAAKMFNVPISIISLVDTDRIWFKSHYGLDATQIGRDPGLCASAILSDNVYIVEDAKNDPRTLANPLVAGEFGLRFYAAAPLQTTDGYNLGTFCIIDRKQRYLTDSQKEILAEIAAIAMDEMEIRLAARQHAKNVNEMLQDTIVSIKDTAMAVEKLPAACKNEEVNSAIEANKEMLAKIEKYLIAQM